MILFAKKSTGHAAVGISDELQACSITTTYMLAKQAPDDGLGLAIVKNIALQYGGSAVASATPGGGLTIEIELEIG